MNAEDIDQSTPLHIACCSEALDSIPILISFGADIHRQNKVFVHEKDLKVTR